MADQDLADYYKSKAPTHFAGWNNSDVIAYAKEKDPNFVKTSKLFYPESGEDEWAAQHPEANGVEMMAKPGQWFQQNVLSPVVSAIDSEVKGSVSPNVEAALGMGLSKKLNDYARGVSDSEDKYIAQGKDFTTLPLVGRVRNPLHGLNAGVHEAIAEFNPYPESTGQAVVGAVMGAGLEGLGDVRNAAEKVSAPKAVEGAFNKAATVLPGANKAFIERDAAKAQFESDLKEAYTTEALREKALDDKAANSLAEQRVRAEVVQRKEWASAAQKNLTGSEDVIPQLDQREIGQHIQGSLDPMNPRSNAALTKEPIAQETNTLIKDYLPTYHLEVKDINDSLAPIKDSLLGVINTPGENSAGAILNKYLNKPEFKEDIPGAQYSLTTVPGDTVYSDAAALGDMARQRIKSNAPGAKLAAKALFDAQEALESKLDSALPENLARRVQDNRGEWAKWYDTYTNPLIKSIRAPIFSGANDPLFSSAESIQAYKKAVSPAEWALVKKNKINELVGKIVDSDSPSKTFESMKKDAPGYYESFLNPNELSNLDSLSKNLNEVGATSILKKDLAGLQEMQDEDGAKARRNSDSSITGLMRRSTDQKPVLKDNTARHQNMLMGAGGMTALTALAFHHPAIAGLLTSIGASGYTAEYLGRLYLNSPEVRSLILDVGSAKNHIEAVRASAVLATMLDAKSEDKRGFENQTGEGPKKPMPTSLKKFEHPKEPQAVMLPSDVEADKEHFQPGFTGTAFDSSQDPDAGLE